ncbi:MAG: ATP-dependent DNA ligase [Thaumarchaeota archaeon]|nr:ATP-dependent DNA ligase [Nitrososphaerota archaeon]
MKGPAPFDELASALEKAKATTSKKEKVATLAEYLKGLAPEEAQVAARLATGKTSERGSKDEAQVGYSTILDSIKEVTGASSKEVSAAYLRHGDLGEVAEELLSSKKAQTLFAEPLTLADVEVASSKLRSSKGSGATARRRAVVKSLILRATPVEGKYLVKALTGEMRTGLVTGLLEEAISQAFSAPREEVARAHMVLGDIGLLAKTVAEGKVGEVRIEPFRPVNFMLAEPMASASEIAEHFEKEVYAEYKYDGVRAQVHRRGGETRVYSRRLEDITTSFPEVVKALSGVKQDFILDGEIVPFAEGRPLPFQLLQRRLRRMEGFAEAAAKAPVNFFAFDILLRGRKELVGMALSERRRQLREILAGAEVPMAGSMVVKSEAEIRSVFDESRALGYEGLVVKDPGSVYTMGKRGSGWVKLKEELDTLDVVIVAAEYGHGKRARVISDYTFAVRDGGELKTVGKAYSGLTDQEIGEMTAKLKKITLKDFGYRRSVTPEVVLEVAFDSIQKSGRHDSGYALRFPRIKRIRTDKSLEDIDTLKRVEEIFSSQKLKIEG